MNKKVIFVPLLLLTIQPNKILGDASTYEQARKEIESVLAMPRSPIPGTIAGVWRSDDNEVDQLLNLVREKSEPYYTSHLALNKFVNNQEVRDPNLTPYYRYGMAIIERYYPHVSKWIDSVSPKRR